MSNNLVALVGAPSVGKSTIFNRIIGERKSIIETQRGVTRDRIYGRAEWLTIGFNCVDTGGIELENRPFQEQIRMQAEIAIDEADVIVLVVDGKIGMTDDDKLVSSILYKSKKPVIVAVNKIDSGEQKNNIYEFYALGLGDPIAVSGVHGIGIGDLLDEIVKKLKKREVKKEDTDEITFSIIGRPNVGKSSLCNSLLKEERVIVSNISGTTRDAIDTHIKYNDQKYCIIDTAGLKKRGKIYEAIDKYAAIRSLNAIEHSDVAVLVIDGNDGVKEQDKHVVGYALDQYKAIILVVNKRDLVEKDTYTMNTFTKEIRTQFKFLDYVPILFVSALKGTRVNKLFEVIDEVYNSYTLKIKTSSLNLVIQDAQLMNETPDFNGGRLKIYFAEQVGSKPLTIALFCNDPNFAHFSYLRYVENKIRESFNIVGAPLKIVLRKRK